MKAFDTDILTEILVGNPAYAERIANVPLEEQSAPIVAIEEILRDRSIPFAKPKLAKRTSRSIGPTNYSRKHSTPCANSNFFPSRNRRMRCCMNGGKRKSAGLHTTCVWPQVVWSVPSPWSRAIAAISSTFLGCQSNSGSETCAESEPLLKQGYEGMKQREKTMPPEALPRLTEALELAQVYDATGNAAEAERWRKELAARKAAQKEPKK